LAEGQAAHNRGVVEDEASQSVLDLRRGAFWYKRQTTKNPE